MRRSTTFAVAIVALALVITGWILIPNAKADEALGCGLQSLRGKYGSATSGLFNSSNDPNAITIPTFIPFAEVALFMFDGKGNLAGQVQPDFGGQIPPLGSATGTYAVDRSACTGTMTINASTGITFHRSFVMVSGGSQIDFVSTDPGLVIAGSMHRQ